MGLALVLLVIDGAKSLAASNIVMTPFSDIWIMVHTQSYYATEQFVLDGPFAIVWRTLQNTLWTWPAFAIFGVLGLLLIFWGRRPSARMHSLGDF